MKDIQLELGLTGSNIGSMMHPPTLRSGASWGRPLPPKSPLARWWFARMRQLVDITPEPLTVQTRVE